MKDVFFFMIVAGLIGCSGATKVNNVPDFLSKPSEWELLYRKIDDSVFNFYSDPGNCFVVKFLNRRFKKFDGQFSISGLSKDTSSIYYTRTPFTGFYYLKQKEAVDLYWFKNISWSMNFNRNNTTREIRNAFRFEGTYEERNDSLFFYRSDDPIGRKDVIVMRRYTASLK